MCRWLLFVALLGAGLSLAAPDTPDASDLPDASTDQGGADRGSPEQDDSSTTCQFSSDCERGFTCASGRCRYQAPRSASGCGGLGVPVALGAVGLLVASRRRS